MIPWDCSHEPIEVGFGSEALELLVAVIEAHDPSDLISAKASCDEILVTLGVAFEVIGVARVVVLLYSDGAEFHDDNPDHLGSRGSRQKPWTSSPSKPSAGAA